jgi:hypothetical protein
VHDTAEQAREYMRKFTSSKEYNGDQLYIYGPGDRVAE